MNRAGQVWDTGTVVGVIFHTQHMSDIPGWWLHTFIKLYSEYGGEGTVEQWSEVDPWENYEQLVRIV